MRPLVKGRYRARFASSPADVEAAQRLRHRCFIAPAAGGTGQAGGRDMDAFDGICRHVLVEEAGSGRLMCCFRLLPLGGGHELGRSYSAQFYDLSSLERFAGPMVEVGRFCIRPGCHDPDILRVAWGALTRFVDGQRAELLFGCTSFPGTRAEDHLDAFALLRARHLAPPRWQPGVKAPEVFRFAHALRRRPDPRRALKALPPLLRSYLAMGGWVSNHAVIDRALGTVHVFTGLEVRAIPPSRVRVLRALAG